MSTYRQANAYKAAAVTTAGVAVAFGAVVLVIIASIGNAYLSDGLSHR